jgi:hypothetical protein
MLGSGLPLKAIINKTNAKKKKKRADNKMKRNRSRSLSHIEEMDNGTMVGMMRKAFHKEVDDSHLYKKLPLRKKSNKSKYSTPNRRMDKSLGRRSRSHSKISRVSRPASNYSSVRKSSKHRRSISGNHRSPRSVNQLKRLIYKD